MADWLLHLDIDLAGANAIIPAGRSHRVNEDMILWIQASRAPEIPEPTTVDEIAIRSSFHVLDGRKNDCGDFRACRVVTTLGTFLGAPFSRPRLSVLLKAEDSRGISNVTSVTAVGHQSDGYINRGSPLHWRTQRYLDSMLHESRSRSPLVMSSTALQFPVILYHYSFSPYARRVAWYLRLRGIPYLECLQPPTLPRPSLALLGLKYRRIPILSIGRDVYLDSRLILSKLTQLFPDYPSLSSPPGTPSAGIERLFSTWTTDAGLFGRATQLLPGAELPLIKDPAFQRDRADFTGTSVSREEAAALRPVAMAEIRDAIELLETTFLADGREWVQGGGGPTTADIEAVWVVHWVTGLKGALDEGTISRERFPKVFAWVERFQQRVTEAKRQGEVKRVSGEEARGIIDAADFAEEGGVVDTGELVVRYYRLEKGQRVEVWPTDSGSAHVDVGRLLSLDQNEVVFETDRGVRAHAPRHGFRVRPATGSQTVANL